MMRDTVFQAGSQSETKKRTSAGLYGFIRSAIVAGFEAYGSAQIGVAPPSALMSNVGDEGNERSAPKTTTKTIGSRSVADTVAGSVPNVRICARPDAMNAVWGHA